jgi:hypothetical protein
MIVFIWKEYVIASMPETRMQESVPMVSFCTFVVNPMHGTPKQGKCHSVLNWDKINYEGSEIAKEIIFAKNQLEETGIQIQFPINIKGYTQNIKKYSRHFHQEYLRSNIPDTLCEIGCANFQYDWNVSHDSRVWGFSAWKWSIWLGFFQIAEQRNNKIKESKPLWKNKAPPTPVKP